MDFLNWFAEHYILGIIFMIFALCVIEMLFNTIIYIIRPQLGFKKVQIKSNQKTNNNIQEADFKDSP